MDNLFVNYNNSLALKEKGYNKPFFFFYRSDDETKEIHHAMVIKPLAYNQKNVDDEVISAPTQQEALIWLEEQHNIYVSVVYDYLTKVWNCSVRRTGCDHIEEFYNYTHRKNAVNAALEYVIKSLI